MSEQITPFERIMIKEAFSRCYILAKLVRNDSPSALRELAHQTGLRLSFLEDNKHEIQKLTVTP